MDSVMVNDLFYAFIFYFILALKNYNVVKENKLWKGGTK